MDNHPNINCWFCGAEQTDIVKRISELEAERSELRNKVIEEIVQILPHEFIFSSGCNWSDVKELLNSLKTK